MKLEMKKIALIMAAGIFAFSGAFGQTAEAEEQITEVQVDNSTVGDIKEVAVITEQGTETVPARMGEQNRQRLKGKIIKKIRLAMKTGEPEEVEITLKGKKRDFSKLKQRLEKRFPNATFDTKVDNGVLTITIKKKAGTAEAKTGTKDGQPAAQPGQAMRG